jgi:hypothetical protein
MTTDSGTYDDATQVRRKMAAALLGQTLKPEENVKHWAQGLSNLAKAGIGGYMGYQANQEAAAEKAKGQADLYTALGLPAPAAPAESPGMFSKIGALLSGGSPDAPQSAPAGPSSDQASYPPPTAPAPPPTTFRPGIAAPAAPDVTAPDFSKAIAGIESGGAYDKLGPQTKTGDRAFGKYQVMGANIPEWTTQVLGKPMTPEQFLSNPDAQEAVFKAKFGDYVQKYGPEGAAKAWFAGEKGMNNPNAKDVLGTTVAGFGQKFTQALGPQGAPQIAAALTAPAGAPTDVSAVAKPPAVSTTPGILQGVPDEKKLQIAQLLNSKNPVAKALGTKLMEQALAASDTPKFDFKTAGDNLYRTNARTGTAEPIRDVGRSVKPMSDDERKQWKVPEGVAAGIDDNGKPVFSQPSAVNTVSPVVTGINERFDAQMKAAQAAPQVISSIHEARRALDSGAITGLAADTRLMWAKAQTLFGLPNEAVANTETARAALGNQVLESAKTLGANPSNADRDYIEKVKGGSISLDEASMRRLLDMQEKWGRDSIKRANESGKKLVQTDPEKLGRFAPMLQVDEPPVYEDYIKNNPAKAATPAAPAKPAVPQPGTIQDGYRFKGGNPADPKSWEQVS